MAMYSGGLRQIFDFPGKAKSDVWRNFGFYMSEDGYTLDKSSAVCKLCRTSTRYTGNTTNLHTHYVNHHLRHQKKPTNQVVTFTEVETSTTVGSLTDAVRMPVPISGVSPSTKGSTKLTPVTYALIEHFICDMVPFSMINSSTFKNLLYTLDKNCDIPTQRYLEEVLLPDIYKERQQRLLNKLEAAENITLTTDVWRTSETYVTLSVSFIGSLWQFSTFTLKTFLIPDGSSAGTLSERLEDLFQQCSLSSKLDKTTLISGDDTLLSAGTDLKWNKLKCFAETLNMAVNKGLKCSEIQKMIQSARDLVYYFKTSPYVFDTPSFKLVLDCPDRWMSTYHMLQKVLDSYPVILEGLDDKDDIKSYDFFVRYKDLCHELLTLLKPLNSASMLLCEQQITSASLILPILKKLELTLFEDNTFSPAIKDLRDTIWAEIQNSYSSEESRHLLLLCSLLDPRYKGLKYVEPLEREKARRLLYDSALKPFMSQIQIKQEVEDEDEDDYIQKIIMGTPFSISSNSGDSQASTSVDPAAAKKRKMAASSSDWLSDVVGHKDDTGKDQLSPTETVSVELDRYMKEKQITTRDPYIWWHERDKIFPNLSGIARKHLSILGVSKPAERVLLSDRDVVRNQRAAISDNMLDAMIFLNMNYHSLKFPS